MGVRCSLCKRSVESGEWSGFVVSRVVVHHRVGVFVAGDKCGLCVCSARGNLQIIITFAMVEYVGRGRMPLFL